MATDIIPYIEQCLSAQSEFAQELKGHQSWWEAWDDMGVHSEEGLMGLLASAPTLAARAWCLGALSARK